MTITYEQIAKRAFEIWQQQGEVEGKEQENWLQAEAELRDKASKERKKKPARNPMARPKI